MQSLAFLFALTLSLFSSGVFTLPGGCGGTVGVLNVTKGSYDGLIWTCSGIDPASLYRSGQNALLAVGQQASALDCANYCSGWGAGMNAGVYYPNSTCACWEFGDIVTSPSAATLASSNATFLDFYETGSLYGPPAAVDWGRFTCPEGVYREWVVQKGVVYGACYPLNIEPGQAALADCPSPDAHWQSWHYVDGFAVLECYEKLSKVKISANYSSDYTLVDIYDFTSQTSTLSTHASTSKHTTTKKLTSKTTHTSTSTPKSSKSTKKSTSTHTTTSTSVHTTTTVE